MAESVGLTPVWQQSQFFDNNGYPLANGKIWTYNSGQDETVTTWTNSTGTIPNANPIRLDSSGRINTEIWIRLGNFYGFVLQDQLGNELARVREVSLTQLIAGTNITLDPPTGTGPNVTINAAGSTGNPKGRGQSFVFAANDTSAGLLFNNTNYSGMHFTALTTPIDITDVSMTNSTMTFHTHAMYDVEVTTTLTIPTGNWPANDSVFGVNVPLAQSGLTKSYHTRYSNGTGDGLGSVYQIVSFTDSFIVSGTGATVISVYAKNATTPTQTLNVDMQIVATRIGDALP